MDPISLIISALVAGTTAAFKDTTGQAVKDAYSGLKTLLKRKFAGKPAAEVALDQHEEKPEVWKEPLRQALTETGAGQDEEVIKAAQGLLEQVDPEGARSGKYNTTIHGNVYGMIQGDHAQLTQNFGETPSKK